MLLLGVAWKVQAQAYGGLKPVTKRQLESLAGSFTGPVDGIEDADSSDVCRPQGADAPGIRDDITRDRVVHLKPGTKLLREWRGETHTVVVLEEGFEWQGSRWRSLSVIARTISGSHRSGPRFFGLYDRKIFKDTQRETAATADA
jgi:hypothetical protein